jgi:hypothetical protein
MTQNKPAPSKPSDLRDPRAGTYDTDPSERSKAPFTFPRTAHLNAQPGADVREEPIGGDQEMPEGLLRPRMGPLNKSTGRR